MNAHGITHQQRNHHWLSPSYREHIPWVDLRHPWQQAENENAGTILVGYVWKCRTGRHELNSSALIPVLNSDTPEENGEVADHVFYVFYQ